MAQLSVGGGQTNGSSIVDNPVINGGADIGNVARAILVETDGKVRISGGAAPNAALSGNPVPVAGWDGSNVQIPNVNTLGQVSVSSAGLKKTFSYGVIGYAASIVNQTDIVNIVGSGTKIVRINKIRISGTATAAGLIDIAILKRSTANSGSTLVVLTATPNDSLLPNASAATAVVNTCTATNPTTGTLVGSALAVRKVALAKADGTGGFPPQVAEFNFGSNNGQGVVLRGVLESLSINLNGVTAPSGTLLDIEIETTEE